MVVKRGYGEKIRESGTELKLTWKRERERNGVLYFLFFLSFFFIKGDDFDK